MKEKSPFHRPPSRPRSTMSPIEVFDPEARRHTAYPSFDVSLRIYDSHIVYDSCPRLVGNPGTKWNQHLSTAYRTPLFEVPETHLQGGSRSRPGFQGSSHRIELKTNQPFGDAFHADLQEQLTGFHIQSLAHDTSRQAGQANGEISTSHNFREETPGLCCCSRGHCCAWCSALRHEAMQKPSLEKKIWKISPRNYLSKKWHSIPFGF